MELTELRDYYIAHAPPVPEWFEPVAPPKPKWRDNPEALALKSRKLKPEEMSADQRALLAAERAAIEEYSRSNTEWQLQVKRERLLQWPLYWADQMMKRRQQAA